MTLHPGDKLHGFTVDRVRPVAELEATMVEMTHDKTGTALVWLDNGEENKLFSIAFKTTPEDDTGVFHILEHSVLCGSDKYPVKEPFVELLKSSMNTFLNAITFSDKTMYPISSRNDADFMNLASVYLDAVFHPMIDRTPNIFLQEGWHIELKEDGAEPVYKGVVFNEMKGATASVDRLVGMGMDALLYPDNCYRFVSGGDPAAIPSLTYEQYLAAYRRYYHPSNARIWLDGAVPLDQILALIDEGYLSRYERLDERHEIAPQAALPARELVRYSELAASDSPEGKAQVALGRVFGTWADQKAITAANVLCDVLAGSPEAPLKRAILEAGLGQDVSMYVNDDIAQPSIVLRVHNTDGDKADAIRDVLRRTVADLVGGALDRESIRASLNQLEYQMRDLHEPAGLMRNITALRSWLHGGDPLQYLVWDETFAFLRESIEGSYYTDLLAMLMDEKVLSLLRLLPSATLGEEKRSAEKQRLLATLDAMTDAEKQTLLAMNQALEAWQRTPDTPEKLAALPKLPLSVVSPLPERIPTEEVRAEGVRVLLHKLPCRGIVHLTLYFALTDGELQERALMASLLGELPTEKHSAAQIQQQVKAVMGRFDAGIRTFALPEKPDECTPCLAVSCSVLEHNLPQAAALLCEILTSTRFDESARIRELVLQSDDKLRRMTVMAGHVVANLRTASHYSAQSAASELTLGYSLVAWVHELVQHFDERIGALTDAFCRARESVFCRARLTLSVTASDPAVPATVLAALPEGTPAPASMACRVDLPMREGIVIPSQVCYAGLGTNLACCGLPFSGSLSVLAGILTYSWLWNEVRVKGGAYGTGFQASPAGAVTVHSYRDPSAVTSLAAYRSMAQFVRSFCESGEVLDSAIIAAIGASERLMSPLQQGQSADADVMNGMTWEKRCRLRAEMLAATPQQLMSWIPLLDQLSGDGAMCILGSQAQLDECAGEGLVVSAM